MSDHVVRSPVDVLFSDADMSRIKQALADDVVSALAAVQLAVGTELIQRQCSRRRRTVKNFLSNHVVAAVVVVWWALVVGRRLPRLIRYWLSQYVVTEALRTQLQTLNSNSGAAITKQMSNYSSGLPRDTFPNSEITSFRGRGGGLRPLRTTL